MGATPIPGKEKRRGDPRREDAPGNHRAGADGRLAGRRVQDRSARLAASVARPLDLSHPDAGTEAGPMTTSMPIACNLDALNTEERARRALLAGPLRAQAQEVRETETGYAIRLPEQPSAHQDAFELALLERRCCPFFRLELTFEPGPGAVWFALGGSPDVKAFLAASGLMSDDRLSGREHWARCRGNGTGARAPAGRVAAGRSDGAPERPRAVGRAADAPGRTRGAPDPRRLLGTSGTPPRK